MTSLRVVCVLTFLAFCGKPLTAAEAGHPPHWEYEGEHGPGHWADITTRVRYNR